MRAMFVSLAVLMLAGCSTVPITGTPDPGIVSKVQSTARSICGFVPQAQVITAIYDKGGWADGALGIARAICDAVVNNPMTEGVRGGRTVPRVRGVAVRGRFVR